ncbi:hypothetical protein ACVSQB_41385, partial [Bradyrhizobium elkanii]
SQTRRNHNGLKSLNFLFKAGSQDDGMRIVASGLSTPSSWRKPGPITTEFDCACDSGPSVAQQQAVGAMGPGFRQDDAEYIHILSG